MLSDRSSRLLTHFANLPFGKVLAKHYQHVKSSKDSSNDFTFKAVINCKFEEINYFFKVTKRLPSSDSTSYKEKALARFLKTIANEPKLIEKLKPCDKFNLLDSIIQEYKNTKNKNDTLNQLYCLFDINEDHPDILKKTSRYTSPDRIARMVECNDFNYFEPLFKDMNKNLNVGSYKIIKYKGGVTLGQGSYIYYKGHVGYIASEGAPFRLDGKHTNKRLRIIYNNGMEINMLDLSLKRNLARYDNVGVVVPIDYEKEDSSNKVNGYIYVVATENKNTALDKYRDNLYKIGYTRNEVYKRLIDAEISTTYLEAPVRLIGKVGCNNNIDPRVVEKKIHSVLSVCRLKISLISAYGQIYKPREWFHVPLETIKEVIKRIGDNTIDDYYIDPISKKLIKK